MVHRASHFNIPLNLEMQKVGAIGEIIARRLFAIVTSPHSKWDVTMQTT